MADTIGPGAYLEGAGTLMQLFGYLSSGRAAKIDGERAKVAGEFAALQATRAASEVLSVTQRVALEERRKGRYEASRALAVAAASGGGATDPTIVKLLSDVKGEAAYRSSVALYEGETQARKLRLQAVSNDLAGQAAEGEGRMMQDQYNLAGTGSLVRGAASLYSKYGGGGPALSRGDAALISQPAGNRM